MLGNMLAKARQVCQSGNIGGNQDEVSSFMHIDEMILTCYQPVVSIGLEDDVSGPATTPDTAQPVFHASGREKRCTTGKMPAGFKDA